MAMGVGLLLGLIVAIVLPILAAGGKGWRGLWFGLFIPLVIVAYFAGSGPVETKAQDEAELGHELTDQEYTVMQGEGDLLLTLSLGGALGCLIAGCVYRRPASDQRESSRPPQGILPGS